MTHQDLIEALLSHEHRISELSTLLISHTNRINELSEKLDSYTIELKKIDSIAKTGDKSKVDQIEVKSDIKTGNPKQKMTKSEAAQVRWARERERKRIETEQSKPEIVAQLEKSSDRNGTCKVKFIIDREAIFERCRGYAPEFMVYLNTLEKDLALAKAYATVQKFEDTLYFPSEEFREEARIKHQRNLELRARKNEQK